MSGGLPDEVCLEIAAVVDMIEDEIARIRRDCRESCPKSEVCRCIKPFDQLFAAEAA
jgi:hypothetical protein